MTWPSHQPTHQAMHPPMGGEVSTDFKSLSRIEISWLVQVLLNFDWFWGSPRGLWGGCMWVGGGERVPLYMCTCMRMHTSAHMCIWHHREFPGILPMGAVICMKLSLRMHVCACACVHAHTCAHVWGAPRTTQYPHPPTPTPPPPQSCREPKTPKFNNSWTNRDNLILFEDSLPLNIPQLI